MSFSETTTLPAFWVLSPRSVVSKLSAKFEPGIWAAPHLLCLHLHNFGLNQSKTEEL